MGFLDSLKKQKHTFLTVSNTNHRETHEESRKGELRCPPNPPGAPCLSAPGPPPSLQPLQPPSRSFHPVPLQHSASPPAAGAWLGPTAVAQRRPVSRAGVPITLLWWQASGWFQFVVTTDHAAASSVSPGVSTCFSGVQGRAGLLGAGTQGQGAQVVLPQASPASSAHRVLSAPPTPHPWDVGLCSSHFAEDRALPPPASAREHPSPGTPRCLCARATRLASVLPSAFCSQDV